MKHLTFAALAAPIFALGACVVQAPDIQMAGLIAANPEYNRVVDQCPLNIYQSRTAVGGQAADCDADPGMCLAQCSAGNATACFNAARVVETGEEIGPDGELKFPLFMAACSLGSANACVNAAATVKNGSWAGTRPTVADGDSCQVRTYRRMCEDGAAWGCYMTAQEYRVGSSAVSQSDARFEQFMRRACAVSETSGACQDPFQ